MRGIVIASSFSALVSLAAEPHLQPVSPRLERLRRKLRLVGVGLRSRRLLKRRLMQVTRLATRPGLHRRKWGPEKRQPLSQLTRLHGRHRIFRRRAISSELFRANARLHRQSSGWTMTQRLPSSSRRSIRMPRLPPPPALPSLQLQGPAQAKAWQTARLGRLRKGLLMIVSIIMECQKRWRAIASALVRSVSAGSS